MSPRSDRPSPEKAGAGAEDERVVIRSRGGIGLCVAVWAIAAIGLGAMVVEGNVDALVHLGPLFLFAAWGCWILLGAPALRIDESAVELVNIARTVRIPWSAIVDVQPGYSLTITTVRRSYHAWAAPGGTQAASYGRLLQDEQTRLHLPLPDSAADAAAVGRLTRPGDRDLSPAARATALVRRGWKAAQADASADVESTAEATVSWHSWQLVVLAVLALASILGLVA